MPACCASEQKGYATTSPYSTAIFLTAGKNAKEVNRGYIKGSGVKSEVIAGEHDANNPLDKATVHPVLKVTAHYNYKDNKDGLQYDFAILTLRDPIDLSGKSNARAICLPDPTDTDFSDQPVLEVSGWGLTDGLDETSGSPVLKKTDLEIASCKPWTGGKNRPDIICGKDKNKSDACRGDSGGIILTSY